MLSVGPGSAEAVSKLETTRFSGVALPFPTCREADTERFDRSTFSLDVEVARFDTASAQCRRYTSDNVGNGTEQE